MSSIRKPVALVSVAAALLVGAPGLALAGTDAPHLGRCGEKVRGLGFRCGHLDVPLERAAPARGEISIAFALRAPEHRPLARARGTILAVEGGPGYGSIGSARAYIGLFGHLLRSRSLLLVDMRGTGHSEAIDCPALQEERGLLGDATAACARQLGDDYGSYRTAAAADDLDSVRRALGLHRVLLYGDSYGTFLAQSYAFRHGDTLDALVLDSAYPVLGEQSGWYPSLIPTGVRSMKLACRRDPECGGGAGKRLNRFVAVQRERGESVKPLLDAIGDSGYSPPESYMKINDAIEEFLLGDPARYERLTRPYTGGYGQANYYSRGDEIAVSCNDYPMIWNKASPQAKRRRELRAAINAYPPDRFRPFTPREIALERDWSYTECLRWPRPSALYQPPAPLGASGPDVGTLVIAGEMDDVTTPREGRMAANLFPNSQFEIVRNAGHVPSLYGDRYPAAKRVREFLSGR